MMKQHTFTKLVLVAILIIGLCISAVSADVKCVLNITKGDTGATGANGTDGATGATGANGTAATITIGTVTSGASPSVTNTGTVWDAIFNFVLEKGDQGDPGYTPVFGVDYFNGSDGYTPIFGTDYFNGSDGYTPVKGVDYFDGTNGTNGINGINGTDGTAATADVNYTFTLAAGSPATVINVGTTSAALFDFGIPTGAQGIQGETGAMNQTPGAKGDKGDPGEIPDSTQFLFLNGTRAMTGNLSMGTHYITGLVDPSVAQDAATKKYVDDHSSSYNSSYVTYNNASYVLTSNGSYILGSNTTHVLTNNASYVLTSNTSYVKNPVFGYVTLMAGSAMITTTNPGHMNQWETTTNKNNFIYLNFTDTGTETAQWIYDFPADWNSSANVIFTPIWTAQSGSGTVHFDISGKLFPNDAAMDTALAAIGDSTDTLITAGDLHVAPDTTGAAISSVATGGNTAIIKIARSSADDTLSGTAQLIGLRIKYARIFA